MHLKFWRAYGLCPRCGEQFSWRRGKHPKNCDDCGYEYWEAYYETLIPQTDKESLDNLVREAMKDDRRAYWRTQQDIEQFNKIHRALTEKRLGHTLPIMAKIGYGKRWKWSIHEEGK